MSDEIKEYRDGKPLRLTEVSMSQQESALEVAYIANHPYLSQGGFDHSWMTPEELTYSLEAVRFTNRQKLLHGSKDLITPAEFAKQMVDLVNQNRGNETISPGVKAETLLKIASSKVVGPSRRAYLELAVAYFREAQMIEHAKSVERWIDLEYPNFEVPPPSSDPEIVSLKIRPTP